MLINYYIKNIVISFFSLVVISAVFVAILDYTPEGFVYCGVAVAIGVMLIGLILIGYYNAYTAKIKNVKHTWCLHFLFLLCLLSFDLLFGDKELWMNIVRNFVYFLALQIGVYIYMKKNDISWKNFQNAV